MDATNKETLTWVRAMPILLNARMGFNNKRYHPVIFVTVIVKQTLGFGSSPLKSAVLNSKEAKKCPIPQKLPRLSAYPAADRVESSKKWTNERWKLRWTGLSCWPCIKVRKTAMEITKRRPYKREFHRYNQLKPKITDTEKSIERVGS